MPLPKNVLYPPFNVIRLSHIELSVKDLSASKAFYVDTLGVQNISLHQNSFVRCKVKYLIHGTTHFNDFFR